MKTTLYFYLAFLFISTTLFGQKSKITIEGETYYYKVKPYFKYYDDSTEEHLYIRGEALGQYYAHSCGYRSHSSKEYSSVYSECANAISIYQDSNYDKTIYDNSLRTGRTYHIGQGEEKEEGEFEIKGAGSNGIWTYYYKNGNKKSSGQLINLRKVKRWTEYHSNGRIKRTVHYNMQERREGICMDFYLNGQVQQVSIYKNGELKKTEEFYLINGKQTVTKGKGSIQYFNNNKERSFTSELVSGTRHGYTTWYYDNGQINETALYKHSDESFNGLRWEIIASFDKKGNKREKGTLKDGNGTWINYDENGKVDYISTYKEGKLVKK